MSIKKQLAANIVGEWDFRKGTLLDQSSGGNDMSFVGTPQWVNSGKGKTIKFNGIDEYLLKTVSGFRGSDSAGSISFWMKTPIGVAADIFSSADQGGATTYLFLQVDAAGSILVSQRNNDTADTVAGNTVLEANQWYHVVVTSSGTAYKIYINSIEDTPYTVSSGANSGDWFAETPNRDNVTIGVLKRNTVAGYYNGAVRELIVWDIELSSLQVSELYEESLQEGFVGGLAKENFQLPEQTETVNKDNLVGEWNMKVDGNQVADVSDNNNNGTVVTANDTEGLFGRAVDLVAANSSSVYMGDVLDNIFAGADKQFTMSIWLNPSAVMTSNAIISKYYTGTAQRQFIFRLKTDSKPSFFWANTLASGSHREVIGSTSINVLNKWVHLVVEYDGTLDTNDGLDRIRMWVDGVEESTSMDITAGTLTEMQNGTASLTVGNSADGDGTIQAGTGGLTGAADLFKVWTGLGGELAASEYAVGAKKLIYKNDLSDEPITVASSVSSGVIGRFGIDSGAWKISYDGTYKWLECVTAGKVTTPLLDADVLTTDTFTVSGSPTLTKTSTGLEIDAIAGEKVRLIIITL